MKKFLSIPMTGAGETYQLIPIDGIILIAQATTQTVTIAYSGYASDATTFESQTITITLGAVMAANDNTVRDRIQDSIPAALQTSWTNPRYEVSLGGLTDAAGAVVTVTGIALA